MITTQDGCRMPPDFVARQQAVPNKQAVPNNLEMYEKCNSKSQTERWNVTVPWDNDHKLRNGAEAS